MSNLSLLSSSSILILSKNLADDEFFQSIALPRLRLLNIIKKQLDPKDEMSWQIKYSPTNKAENCVRISLPDERKKFHFYYELPLSLNCKVHLYLGDNTFNFFEAHPLLIQQNVIAENELKVDATMNTLPHLVLSKSKDKYERAMLSEHLKDGDVEKSQVFKILKDAFERFNPILLKIIDGSISL